MRTYSRLRSWLERPHASRAILLVALLLGTPSLASPLVMDEYAQLLHFRAGACTFLRTAFVFAEPATRQRELEHGMGAWWAAPDLRIAFLRPLAAATQALDFTLWPRSVPLMHVHTLLWFAALLVAAGALFRRLLPTPAIANLALALYAWDDARGQILSWVANRHALLGGLLGCATLLCHDKWRRDAWRVGAVLGPALFGLSLLCSEMALATSGFLLGHALFVDMGRLTRRLLRLVSYACIALAWQLTYTWAGYGTQGSGAYLHPFHEPLAYLEHLPARALLLSLGELTPIASDVALFLPSPVRGALVALAVVVSGLFVLAVLPLTATVRQTGFWLTGAALSLLPVAAIGPSDRNLVFVGLGAAALLALGVQAVMQTQLASWRRIVIGALLFCNLALAPVLLPIKSLYMLALQAALEPTDASIPRDHTVASRTLVVVATGSEGPVGVSFWRRDALEIPRPRAARILVATLGTTSIERMDDKTLLLTRAEGFFEADMHALARGRSQPFQRGEVLTLSDLTVSVDDVTTDGRPRALTFRFAEPLEHPRWIWMRGSGTRLVDWTPPPIGQSTELSQS